MSKGNNLCTQANLADFIPQAGADFVATPSIEELTQRALAYIEIGYAVHLSGPAGTGKTTLALHIASKIGRRCTLLHGDDELRGSDLLGKDSGFRRQSVRDNYVSSILKTEETVSMMWTSNRLTTACEQGHTVIYDEFTRSPAAANNAFLSILEEGILTIPSSSSEKNYVRVHPDFRCIFTSNPEEYVGVHKSQDALIDRMITLEVSHQDRDTELAIVQAKSRRSREESAMIVDVIRALRERLGSKNGPTIRAALAIARIMDHRNARVNCADPVFLMTCQDVLLYNAVRQSNMPFSKRDLESVIRSVVQGNAVPTASSISSRQTLNSHQLNAQSGNTSRETEVSARAEQALNEATETVEQLLESNSADSARSAKDRASLSVLEKKADQVKASDETSDVAIVRETSNRRLLRPPAFETNHVSSGSTVASK